jgi:parallel beta helix pectate lyase-like protein/Big-like domain-containing protein
MAITITSPTNGDVVSGTITVTASVTGSTNGFSTSGVYVDGVLKASGTYPISIPLNTLPIPAGPHSLVVKAKIKGIIYSSNTITINVQNAPMAGTLTQSITQNQVLSGASYAWTATLSNATTTSGVIFKVDGVQKSIDTSSPYSYTLDTTALAEGSHTFVVTTTDTNGNTYTSSVVATVQNVSSSAPSNTALPTISGSQSLASPFSTILDNFNRNDENPLSQSGAWTTMAEKTALKVVSNQVLSTSAYSCSYRGSYTNVEAGIKLGTIPASSNEIAIMLRLSDAGGASPIRDSRKTCYLFNFAGKDTYAVTKIVDNVATAVKATTAWSGGALSDGDSIGCRANGNTLEVWSKRGANPWVKETSVVDTGIPGAGAVAFRSESTTATFDDFSGGAIVAGYQVGTVLTATTGTWTGTPTPTYTYQWLRCDSSGSNAVAIAGATSQTYTLVSADAGSTIRVRVRATNSAGTATADSDATGVIQGSAPPPPPPPPPTQFGELLPARLPESAGSVVNVSSLSALSSALSSAANGSIINITANLNGGGNAYTITRVASASAPITITCNQGVLLTNFAMLEVRGAYLRFRGLDVGSGTIDGIKINVSAHDIEVDKCKIHHNARQGINIQDSPSNIQIWNNRVYSNGSDTNQDHGIYFGHANGNCVVANNVFYDNQAYGIQLYPQATNVICTCNTVDGGVTRGGTVVGSESGLTDNVIIVGLIGTNAPWYCVDLYDPTGGSQNNNTYDSLGFGNGIGDFRTGAGMTYTNCSHLDPLYVDRAGKDFRLRSGSPAIGKIQSARYGYVPPLDIDGKVRTTADAGAFAS